MGRAVPLDQGPRPARQYSADEDGVKGRWVSVLVPHAIADRAEAAGVVIEATCRGAALRGLRDATRLALDPAAPIDPAANSRAAALARAALGQDIARVRREMSMSRAEFMFQVQIWASRYPEAGKRGWGPGQAQQWEMGRSAPKLIEPIIRVLDVRSDEAQQWRTWWAQARRGVGAVPDAPTTIDPPPFDSIEEIEAQIAHQEAELAKKEVGIG
jgi:hypothetical protein